MKIIPEDKLRLKINDLKFNANGDIKNAINSLYVFSLSLRNDSLTMKPIIKEKSSENKSNAKINAKLLKAQSKNDLTKLYNFIIYVINNFLFIKAKRLWIYNFQCFRKISL